MFPSSPEFLTVWRPEEVCKIIGYLDEEGAAKTQSYRRVVRTLRTKGLLERVTKTVQEGVELYGFRTVGLPNLSEAALAVLNKKTPHSVTYCNEGERAALQAMNLIDKLPEVYRYERPGSVPWWKLLPDLLDFTSSQTWEFWTKKAPLSLKGKGHPLRAVEDPDLRLQTALTGLEKGLNRNRDSNPDWKAKSDHAYALHAFKGRVGREACSEPMPAERVQEIRAAARKDGYPTLAQLAAETHGLGFNDEDELQGDEAEVNSPAPGETAETAPPSDERTAEVEALKQQLAEAESENQRLMIEALSPPPRRELPQQREKPPQNNGHLLDPEYCEEHGLNYDEMLARFS